MVGNGYYKKYVENTIKALPSAAHLTRKQKTPDGFGGYDYETIETDIIISLYNLAARVQIVEDSGINFKNQTIVKFLAAGDTDIQEGDILKIENKIYNVTLVKLYFDICKQGEIEVFKDESN